MKEKHTIPKLEMGSSYLERLANPFGLKGLIHLAQQ